MEALLTVLPMAVVMVAGPQIISATLLATSLNARKNSVAFLAGVALATSVGIAIAYFVATLLKSTASSSSSSERDVIDYVVIALLVVASVLVFVRRKNMEPPKWMSKLATATPKFSLRLGLLLFLLMPTDIVTMIAVGSWLAGHGSPWWHSLPFVALTVLLAGIPFLILVLLGKRSQVLLPKIRDWMNTNSWVISEAVIVFFLLMTIKSVS